MLNILIADDHTIVRQGLKQILAERADMVVAGEARTAKEVLEKLRENRWDVVILDLTLPDRSGLDILPLIKSQYPQLPVLVLTMHADELYAVRALKSGASGYLNKESASEELITSIEKVARGGKYVSPSLAEHIALNALTERSRPAHEALSEREFQVMCMMSSGKTIKMVADELCLSIKTVSTHRARILEKMGLKNNAELIRYAIKNNLVQ